MAVSFSLTHQPKLSISSPLRKNMISAKSQYQNSFINITNNLAKIQHHQKQIIMHPLLWCNSSSSSFSPRIITALNSSPMEDQNTSKEKKAEDLVRNLEAVSFYDPMEKELESVLKQVYSDEPSKAATSTEEPKKRIGINELQSIILLLDKLNGDPLLWIDLAGIVNKHQDCLKSAKFPLKHTLELRDDLESIILFLDEWNGDSLPSHKDFTNERVTSNVEVQIDYFVCNKRLMPA
ncbi:unnamed protein product [Amaranthus hypochondriacus]